MCCCWIARLVCIENCWFLLPLKAYPPYGKKLGNLPLMRLLGTVSRGSCMHPLSMLCCLHLWQVTLPADSMITLSYPWDLVIIIHFIWLTWSLVVAWDIDVHPAIDDVLDARVCGEHPLHRAWVVVPSHWITQFAEQVIKLPVDTLLRRYFLFWEATLSILNGGLEGGLHPATFGRRKDVGQGGYVLWWNDCICIRWDTDRGLLQFDVGIWWQEIVISILQVLWCFENFCGDFWFC